MIAVIPARYKSVRLEGKLLLPLAGKPLILHTVGRVQSAALVQRVVVATDDARIAEVVKADGHEVCMTSAHHESGTDRIAEAAGFYPEANIIVNVQADEPMIDPGTVDIAVSALLEDPGADMSTCSESITDFEDVFDHNIVKVVAGADGNALFFSRSPVPFPRNAVLTNGSLRSALENDAALIRTFRKHTGIYAYRREFLLRFASTSPTELEKAESLEQLRALEMGARIKVAPAAVSSTGVDTLADYERVRVAFEGAKT